jgi:hypothetical protein
MAHEMQESIRAYVESLANPASKRPRSEPSNSDSHAGAAGKGVAKIVENWAGPKITEVAAAQHKRAAQLRKHIQSNKEAIAKLQEFSAQEKTPTSLTVKLAPAAAKMLPHLPAAAQLIKQTEKTLIAEALRRRQDSDTSDQAELSCITDGDQFDIDARAATHFDSLKPKERGLVETLIAERKEEFLVCMHFLQLDMSAKEENQRQAKAKRATAAAAHAMEMDQLPTSAAIKGVVTEVVAAQLAKEMAKLRKQANSGSRKKVQFGHRQPSRGNSRGRARSHSRDPSQPRGRERGRSSHRFSTPVRGSSRGNSKRGDFDRSKSNRGTSDHGRPATPTPQRRRPFSSRSKSRENSRGGRGARPHRSPSAKHGGRERNAGVRGSKMGARR